MHPKVLDAIVEANHDHAHAYGDDPWTSSFNDRVQQLFGEEAMAFPVFNGTGGNVLALQAALPRWAAVICSSDAHVHTDETGAPEKTGGLKLLPVETPDGKLTPDLIAREAKGFGDQHSAQPLAVTISQTTELGTCYQAAEVQAIADFAHEHGMVLHVDGSRLSNAAAHLGCDLAEAAPGADLLSLGGTKNGALGAEAVVVLRPGSAPGIEFLRKINLQLASKMRFLSAQLLALYSGELWRENAAHANAMAQRLRKGLERLSIAEPGIAITQRVESNVVFARLPPKVADRALAAFPFYEWPTEPGLYRLMCAWDTRADEVDALLAAIAD